MYRRSTRRKLRRTTAARTFGRCGCGPCSCASSANPRHQQRNTEAEALLRPNRPRATWLEPGYIRVANLDPLCTLPKGRATLTANFPTRFLKGQRPAGANATGVWHTHDYYKRVSKAMNKALRHFPLTFVALPTSRI